MSHLLSLSAMHRDGPGSLDVVFGPDGDFEGAPRWVGPVLTPQGYRHSLRGVTISRRPDLPGGILINGIGDRVYPSADVALDLRIPSVAARLAGLCARALGATHSDGWIAYFGAEHAYLSRIGGLSFQWRFADGTGVRSHNKTDEPDLPVTALSSGPALIAALTLTLAPKIAALGGPRG